MFYKKVLSAATIILCFCVGQAFAGGVAKKRQQSPAQIRIHQQQQIMAQRKIILDQQAVQRAAQQAAAQAAAQTAMMAQYQAQKVAVEAAAIQQQVMKQSVAAQVEIQRHIQGQVAGEVLTAGLQQKMAEENAQVEDIVTLDQMLGALEESSENWPLMIDLEAKAAVVSQYIYRYRQQGVAIRKPAVYYAQMIDGMSEQAPEMLQRPFPRILETVAIIEYDFENGSNKDALARKVLGSDQAVAANKQRLGIR